jgi:hypothetical protein
MARILNWDGQHLPDGMRSLPPGRYVIEEAMKRHRLLPRKKRAFAKRWRLWPVDKDTAWTKSTSC